MRCRRSRAGARWSSAGTARRCRGACGASIFPFADGGTAVYRIEGGRARLQPVELGGRNGSEGWVRSGLEPGQSVIV